MIFQGFVLFIKVKSNFKKRFKNFGSVSSPIEVVFYTHPVRLVWSRKKGTEYGLSSCSSRLPPPPAWPRRWRRPQQASFTGRHYRHERLFGGAAMGTEHTASFDKKIFHSTIPALGILGVSKETKIPKKF